MPKPRYARLPHRSPPSRRALVRAVAAMLPCGLSLAGCAAAGSHVAVAAGPAMRDGGAVMPPAGWLDYCSRHTDDMSCHAAELTPARARQLTDVLTAIRALPTASDISRFGKAEYWEAADRSGGDCEDFALAARARLLAMDWPKTALRLATAWTEKNEYHLVLTVDVRAAGQVATVVIDRRFPRIESWQRLRKVGYRFLARQSAIGATWVQIEGEEPGAPPVRRDMPTPPPLLTASIDPVGRPGGAILASSIPEPASPHADVAHAFMLPAALARSAMSSETAFEPFAARWPIDLAALRSPVTLAGSTFATWNGGPALWSPPAPYRQIGMNLAVNGFSTVAVQVPSQ